MSTSSRTAAIPVYLLTGFLGSGKTTLLSRLVRQADFSNTAVIVNEFGDIGLDHVLLEKSDDTDVMLLDSGCLCCATNNPLQDSLESLYYRRLRGEVPSFERVVVETSGLADPAPLINALAANASVAAHYELAGVITTIDAVHGRTTLEKYREAATQLAVADRVVITKTDLTTPTELDAVCTFIAQNNPLASVMPSSLSSNKTLNILGDLHAYDIKRKSQKGEMTPPLPAGKFAHLFRYGISSHILRLDKTVAWGGYAAWVTAMQRKLGDKLLRVKGIVSFEDGDTYAIHGVHHLFSPPRPLKGVVPDAQLGTIVIIAQDIAESDLLELFPLLTAKE